MKLTVLMLMACLGCIESARAAAQAAAGPGALAARAQLDFTVKIPLVLKLELTGHPTVLTVTQDDVARGYSDVRGGRINIVSTHRRGYVLRLELRGNAFTSMDLEGLDEALQSAVGGATVAMPSVVGKPRPLPKPVAYRLHLSSVTAPGTYAWPVALSVGLP